MILTQQRILCLVFRIVRQGVLLGILASLLVLWCWNRDNDPRFHHFLGTRPGKILGSLTGWTVAPGHREKSEAEMSAQELGYKRSLEKVIQRQWPEHIMALNDGSQLQGSVLGETPGGIRFKPVPGETKRAELVIPRSLIDHVEKNRNAIRPITYRDVQFKMEYPDLGFLRSGPYTMLTDADTGRARALMRKLDKLDADLRHAFRTLLRPAAGALDTQVVYVVEKKRFLANRNRFAHDPSQRIAGLYIPDKERLIIYDQLGGGGKSKLPELEFVYTVPVYAHVVYRQNMQVFIDETHQTLRHEGAHHFLFKYGIHSDFHAENPWLIEGLACYFESETPGDLVSTYVNALKGGSDYGHFIPLDELVNYRSSDGIMPLEGRFDLSYAQSWALVRMLMQADLRPGFFQYMRFIRNPDNLGVLAHRPRIALLADQLGLSIPDLESRWLRSRAELLASK